MMNYDFLKEKPFYLNDMQMGWVMETLNSLTTREKIGQLFCLISYTGDHGYLSNLSHNYQIGGIMGRRMPLEEVCDMTNFLQKESKIPLLIAANFEAGGDGLIEEGTNIGPNLQIGATNQPEFAGKQGYVCAREGLAVGANWAFAPVIDIDKNFRNPIMATRLFGSEDKLVKDCGVEYTRAAQGLGMAVSIKHFPGDGVDERDQHLVTSSNDLSCEEWDKSYGEAYQACIDAGALTVMIGHIMQPAYSRRLCPGIKDEDIMPATLAPELINGLLRDKLGFNGLIVTDATTMAGFAIPMPRNKAVPYTIAAGCDVFLFTKNLEEDYAYMTAGVEDGTITPQRLNEAVARILGLKATLRLPEKKADGSIFVKPEEARRIVGCEEHKSIELDCADRAITLIKDTQKLLPIHKEKHKRILIYPITSGESAFGGGDEDIAGIMKDALEREGFIADIFQAAQGYEGMLRKYQDVVDQYDLMIYVGNMATKSNQTTVRIEWAQPMGADCPIYQSVIPTIFISFANPYHLLDVPRVRTFINAYKFKESNINAVIDKLLGRSDFKGITPVDPFCGRWDAKL